MQKLAIILSIFLLLTGCGKAQSGKNAAAEASERVEVPVFDADSAFAYVKRQVDFGPRVPNTAAHRATTEWLAESLRRRGAEVVEQKALLKAFDGTMLNATNIIGQFNPEAEDRLLLLAHYDCRPWADEDADESKRSLPVDGANDGASGVGVLLEVARQIALKNPGCGVDILFVDAEDYGSDEDEDSWALGTKYFVEHPFKEGYVATEAILLDMVGGRDARFYHEYFSQQNAPSLASRVWACAEEAGYGDRFINRLGGAVNDDHRRLIDAGIPAIDIIEYNPSSGFNPAWHTSADNMDNIDAATLKAVGQTLLNFIYGR
ncbi:MAG: M28 family peptidase [Bacteroidales bacterium]|nr:M28 family peptidase [Bacteroidales bacterium]